MALPKHETKAVAGSVVSPATTLATIRDYGADAVLMSTTANIYFTTDGVTNPVVTGAAEVGTLLRSTDLGIILTPEEFLNLKMLDVTDDARVQFEFLSGDRHRVL